MDKKLLESLNEMRDEDFTTLADAKAIYSSTEILDSWLRYEGISGYTSQIISALKELEI